VNELEKRIQRLEDIEAIRVLKASYFHACDRKDTDTIKQCFAEGSITIDYGAIGQFTRREDFLEVYKEMACHPHIVDMHHGQNAQIEWISPDEAQAKWDLYFYQIDTHTRSNTQLAGYYDDRYQKHNGRWVMVYCKFTVTSSYVTPIVAG
jgi:hypothetical protein